jgi:hypothetical protein
METLEEKTVGARSLTHNTSGVKGCVGAPRCGLRWLTSGSIISNNLAQANNKLLSARLKYFWCTNELRAYMDSQDSPWLRLGGSYHLCPYSILCAWPWGLHSNVILSWDSQVGNLKIFKIEILAILEADNFLCKPSIGVKFKENL